jgi:cobalt-zinc-cadmium efflux system outer membrane protein
MPSVSLVLAGLLCTLLWSGGVRADSLAAALDAAWARHPQGAALAARGDEAAARAALAASLTAGPASLAVGHLGDGFGHDSGRREWEIELAAPLWLPGQQAARRSEAASGATVLAATHAALRLQLAGAVRDAGWAVVAARGALELAQQREASARALEAEVQRRHAAGELARIDANQARGERLAAETAMADAATALRGAEYAWRALTGLPAPLAIDTERVAGAGDADPPQLAAALAALHAAQARAEVSRASRRDPPEVALRAVRERDAVAEPWSTHVGVQLRVPFSADAQVALNNAAAQAELAEAKAALEQARLAHALEVARARAELDAAVARDNTAGQRQLLAAESLQLVEKSFALGESNLATLLRLRSAALDADAEHAHQRVARAAAVSRLNQALGVLP